MKFVCYSSWDQIPDSANSLFEQSAKECIFFSRPWFESLSTTAMDHDHSMVLACVLSGDRVMAILPLMKCAGTSWYSLRHRYTPHYSLLLMGDKQAEVLACLTQGMRRLPISGLILEPVGEDDHRLTDLQRALEAAGVSCEWMFRHYNWICLVKGQSFEGYMAARPATLRNTIARKQRKLEREHGYAIRLFRGDEVPDAMVDYYAVYSDSWKANEQYAGLVDDMVERFSRAAWSRLGILYVNGKAIAAQLWFVCHGKASIFRLAYDEAWKHYSPGSILTSYLMEYVIDTDKVEEIDFLTGNEAYKQDWMSERRARYALSCSIREQPLRGVARFVAYLKHVCK